MRTIYRLNGNSIALDAPQTINGVTYPNLRGVWQEVGVTQHQVEDYPNPDTHTWTENADGTLNVSPLPVEVITERNLAKAKLARLGQVREIKVTTASGKEFDGDEDSQNRMSRAISAMEDTDTTQWVLVDNTIHTVSKAELKEALKLAGIAMTTIWMKPYE